MEGLANANANSNDPHAPQFAVVVQEMDKWSNGVLPYEISSSLGKANNKICRLWFNLVDVHGVIIVLCVLLLDDLQSYTHTHTHARTHTQHKHACTPDTVLWS